LGDIAFARVALRDWPAVKDCNVIGMRAGDSNGVVSKPEGVRGAGGVGGLDGVVVAGEVVVTGEDAVVVAGEVVAPDAVGALEVVGALAAGALATGTVTARPARTAPKAARCVREIEWAPTEARYAGAWLRRKSR